MTTHAADRHERDRRLGRGGWSRRTLLRGAGAMAALPLLEALLPRRGAEAALDARPMRAILISNNLGVLPKPFFPTESGRDYTLSPDLEIIARHRNDFTVISGLSHPNVRGGHSTENCFLTAARNPTASGFRNTISLDQFAAERLGQVTRFPTLNLGVNIDRGNRSLAWTRDGVLIPAEDRPSRLYERMFVVGSPAEVAAQLERLRERGSILDTLADDARRVSRRLGAADRGRIEQYFTSIRELEERLQAAGAWERRPKPAAPAAPPEDVTDRSSFFRGFEAMLTMARLAIESDSTRIVTLMVDAFATPAFKLGDDETTTEGYHGLSHHGQAADKVRQLEAADRRQMELFGDLLEALGGLREGDRRLLDGTVVLYGSNLGDANTHDNTNLPILLAGGGFRHGTHLAFPREDNPPLCNLFVTLLRRLGVDADSFGSSTGPLAGLDA
ncbi:MAG: DUF1552 domain-containing protein [Planctomycetia bacterium]